MELILSIVVIAVIVWYFGTTLGLIGDTANNAFASGARMTDTKMKVYESESKASAIEAMSKIEIDTDKVAAAKANMEALRSIDL